MLILEYLFNAYEDKGLFPANVGGWIKTYRIADNLKILESEVSKCCSFLYEKGLIKADSNFPNFQTSQPLVRISVEGIEHLKELKAKLVDAWHFEKRGDENASLAENWQKTGVNPHVRLEVIERKGSEIEARVYGQSSFIYSVWEVLTNKTVNDYSFYRYYEKQSKEHAEKGFFWLRNSGFWNIIKIIGYDDGIRVIIKMEKNISYDEIELFILQKCVDQYKKAETNDNLRNDKCAREINISEALAEITGESGTSLEHSVKIWLNRLAPLGKPVKGPLRRCSNSNVNMNEHKHHVRAFVDPYNRSISAWERIRELKRQTDNGKEMEHDFGILYNKSQMENDFKQLMINEEETENKIAVLYIDIDDFKSLNSKYTESLVDKTILPDFQKLLKEITNDNGKAYREHGDEFVVILPNHNQRSALRFAEKLRSTVESKKFNIGTEEQEITVSIGVALWPDHGHEFDEVKSAANMPENLAKKTGKNRVILAD